MPVFPDAGDDFTAVAFLQSGTNFNVGDTNRNGMLDPGETWLYTATGTALDLTLAPDQLQFVTVLNGLVQKLLAGVK